MIYLLVKKTNLDLHIQGSHIWEKLVEMYTFNFFYQSLLNRIPYESGMSITWISMCCCIRGSKAI